MAEETAGSNAAAKKGLKEEKKKLKAEEKKQKQKEH